MNARILMSCLALSAVVALAQVPAPSPPPIVAGEPVVMAEAPVVASVDVFEPALAPYGQWVIVNGLRAWRPAPVFVGVDFVPYVSAGRWVWTDAGWSFESTLPFGWATFHYGRWWFDSTWGWVWLPDTVWAPAWVEWRFGGGYTGWAPLPPHFFLTLHHPRWFFVESPWFCSDRLVHYLVPMHRHRHVLTVAHPVAPRMIHGVTWHVGPPLRDVEHVAVVPPPRRPVITAPPPATPPPPVPGGTRVTPPPGVRPAPMPPPPTTAPPYGTPAPTPPAVRTPTRPPPTYAPPAPVQPGVRLPSRPQAGPPSVAPPPGAPKKLAPAAPAPPPPVRPGPRSPKR